MTTWRLAGLLVLGTTLSGVLVACDADPGPLRFHDGGSTTGIQADVGDRVAFGGNLIANTGADPVTDIQARLVLQTPVDGGSAGAVLVEVMVIDLAANAGYLGAGQWPNKEFVDHARSIEGYALAPGGGDVSLLFVLDVRRDGRWKWTRTEVSYRYQGERYTASIDNGLVICAPATYECGF